MADASAISQIGAEPTTMAMIEANRTGAAARGMKSCSALRMPSQISSR